MRDFTKILRLLPLVLFAGACVSSELEVPRNHPGHPSARTGKVQLTSAHHPDLDVRVEPDESASPHAGHSGHGTPTTESNAPAPPASAGSAAPAEQAPAGTYVCPMHPEIIRKEPGKCPICGMKLVPRKGDK